MQRFKVCLLTIALTLVFSICPVSFASQEQEITETPNKIDKSTTRPTSLVEDLLQESNDSTIQQPANNSNQTNSNQSIDSQIRIYDTAPTSNQQNSTTNNRQSQPPRSGPPGGGGPGGGGPGRH